ncbi:hypothetical protein A2767_07135 [Candidatus Roizmanbacteria bacterium RIFCSPHIGHO2_01_FULL_35_10]|uniref:Uncharacterized protein n=1 Tax=Candidatus Roizmanbacteria bacterium RIFCSPLOWO2_01_FULL_35_13 TaxID=1802055 RepID=A0A1F7ID82_9BACT|nr:MAG: hypothetical protein A2767_07135 [Candidatus Roizmanbacteria bacterium RIFCSPHIGHO2_01_FULL_35_10]OGK41329.1 MAG: hypothetical protein A3A74_03275 [Candidatus Roizmanbacteria bacterium RIFCSPLOWO2_01_FULL_35_13]
MKLRLKKKRPAIQELHLWNLLNQKEIGIGIKLDVVVVFYFGAVFQGMQQFIDQLKNATNLESLYCWALVGKS